MPRYYFIAALFFAFLVQTGMANGPRPNILYFYVDDMGWGSIGPNGQAERRTRGLPAVKTPNLDQLAARGINFTRGYGCHVCSPARSSQQSGFHQGHTFADRNDPDNAKKAMRADDILMGDALSAAGYATGYWGKWGYGGSKDQQAPVIQNVQTLPTSHGYQHVLAELHHVRAHTFFQPTLWKAPAARGATGGLELVPNSMSAYTDDRYPSTPALQQDPNYPATAYCDDSYAFAALDFVRQQGQQYNASGKPFFGLLAVQIPHAPFGEISSLPNWDEAYADDPKFQSLADQTRQWAAMVTRIDAHFGNILAALEDPNHDGDRSDSIADNTLVIFQSDNGGPKGKNHQELDSNGGLRGVKGDIHEGGIRVPLLMRWPAMVHENSRLKSGTNTDMVVDVTDLLPTFCELAGVQAPLGIDGVSIAPTLTGNGHQRKREFLIHEANRGQSIIHGNHKLIREKNEKYSLYDLKSDPDESDNLAADHPELVNELKDLLLGERVAEERGFANTYHHWTGASGDFGDADNWSDYSYSNAGIEYQSDIGVPKLAWVAHIANTKAPQSVVEANRDAEFLALEVRGGEQPAASQTLSIPRDVTLTTRNELRVNSGGEVSINGGTVSTLRWVDVLTGGRLRGSGTIQGDLINAESVASSGTGLTVKGDFRQTSDASLEVEVGDEPAIVSVTGEAALGGTLKVKFNAKESRSSILVLKADSIQGTFANADQMVTANDGTQFTIHYTENTVTLKPTAAK